MQGRIRKKLLENQLLASRQAEVLICPLCNRPIPDSEKDESKGGREIPSIYIASATGRSMPY